MPTKSPQSAPHGEQVPRVRHAPHVRANAWEDVVDLAKGYGLVMDEWQENVLEAAMGERSDGRWAATTVGVNVARQNGKGALLEARALSGLLLFGERVIVHSAHEQKTARIGFQRLLSYFENYDDLRKKVRSVMNAVNREHIILKSGAAIYFPARSKGALRGFTLDCLLLDEAQILGDAAWDAVKPTLSARPNVQTWLMGTTPTPLDDSAVFDRTRLRALEGKDTRLCWCEWSAESTADLDDPVAWAQANPALGLRISDEAIRAERAEMSDDGFARERLSMWAGTSSGEVITGESWRAIADNDSMAVDRFAVAVDVSPDRAVSSVALAGQREDGRWHVELDEQRAGVGWLAGYLVRLIEANPQIRAVVIDGASPAASIIDELARSKIKVTTSQARDMAAACGQFYDGVHEDWLRHIDQPQLNVALSVARKRSLGDAWAWNRKNANSDITPIVASTLALWGAQSSTVKKPGRKARPEGRKAVLL